MHNLVFFLVSLLVAPPQDAPKALVGARVITMAGPDLEKATVVFQGGKILRVGPVDTTAVPEEAERLDATGLVIMPGLVDTHSHIGGGSGGDGSGPLHPDARIMDSFDARDAGVRKARAGGITTVNVMPGSGHLMSGQTLYLKLRAGANLDELLIKDEKGSVAGGLKMANGTNPQKGPPFPGTRAKSAALVRGLFTRARDHQEKIARAAGDLAKVPDRDIGLEAVIEALSGRRIVHHHTHRHDDVLSAIRIAKEFGLRMVLHHVSEAWKVADEIAKAGVQCSIIVIDSPGGKLEAVDLLPENGAALEKAGVAVAFHTDDPITDSRLFLRSAALAVRAGMSRRAALDGLTLVAARMLDLQDRTGSLEPGKDADFVVLSGDPLSVYTKVMETWVEGVRVFDRTDATDRLFAEGGYGAGRAVTRLCCFEDEGR